MLSGFAITIDFPALDRAVTFGNRWLDYIESRDQTQAVVDDATKRIQEITAGFKQSSGRLNQSIAQQQPQS